MQQTIRIAPLVCVLLVSIVQNGECRHTREHNIQELGKNPFSKFEDEVIIREVTNTERRQDTYEQYLRHRVLKNSKKGGNSKQKGSKKNSYYESLEDYYTLEPTDIDDWEGNDSYEYSSEEYETDDFHTYEPSLEGKSSKKASKKQSHSGFLDLDIGVDFEEMFDVMVSDDFSMEYGKGTKSSKKSKSYGSKKSSIPKLSKKKLSKKKQSKKSGKYSKKEVPKLTRPPHGTFG